MEEKIKALERIRSRLMAKLDARGGRGMELANAVDRVALAIDSLKGELFCPHCQAQLTSPGDTDEDEDD